ncbi:MAG: aspartate--tRNA(Asn) ligase [Candidatus Anstonellales archaeon]
MLKEHTVAEAKEKKGEVSVCGWVHEVRNLGRLKFVLLRDWTGMIQITAKQGKVSEEVLNAMDVNKEDVVCVQGEVVENKIAPDGVEIVPKKFKLLGKVTKKLPVDPTGVVDSELDTRLNYRFIDLRKKNVETIFRIKSQIVNAFRNALLEKGFIEIHPSVIIAAASEGGADVFPIQYFEQKAYLAQSPQIYKQLAVIGGLEKVFITTPVFRAEKHNTTTHLNEIIQMDIEAAFYTDKEAIEMLIYVFKEMLKRIDKEDVSILNKEFKEIKKVNIYTYTELVELLNENKHRMEWGEDFSKEAEKKLYELLGEEAFVIKDWPTKVRAFYSMPYEDNEEICKAYDLMYRGIEIASGAQRIHIPELLEKQIKKRGLDPLDFEFYIDAFRYGAPPHAGWSFGLERLTMTITGMKNIREAMLFPRDRMRIYP